MSFRDHLGQVAGMLARLKAGNSKVYYWASARLYLLWPFRSTQGDSGILLRMSPVRSHLTSAPHLMAEHLSVVQRIDKHCMVFEV